VTTAEGNLQGGTGQGVSAADFFPLGHQYKKEAEAHGGSTQRRQNYKEALAHDVGGSGAGAVTNPSSDDEGYNMADAKGGYMVDADRQAMRDLADNRSIRGTSANRMAADVRATEAAPGWTGAGANYATWLRDLRENPMKPDTAIIDGAPERAYLVVMNGDTYMSVIHHLFRWKHQTVDAVASTDALWHSKGKSVMYMVSPASGGLTRRRRGSYNFGPSRPAP
jgi:hypothetical protein